MGLKPGEIFRNDYKVLQVIGKGGVSTVYKAEHLQSKQFVAIKLLHAGRAHDEELVRRFIREAQTTTRLDHPHAIHIWEWGIDQQDRPFMVIEFLAGETLARRIQKGNGLNYNNAVEIMDQICSAMQEAHSLGIIHRDLKPDNIMLTTHQGVDDWVKVCDFGIARLEPDADADESAVSQPTLTRAGAILGTPMYMSPEQLRGRKADARSDIYSLGCIMYEMLTGKPPFASKNTADIVVGHLNLLPEPPHKVRIDLAIPEALSAAVMRALAKNPWERPTTVQEFMASLRRAIEKPALPKSERPRPAPPPSPVVETPTPRGMVVDPMRRVCFKCKTVASGGNFRFCLKCGQDNTGKWLPYHSAARTSPPAVIPSLSQSELRRLLLWILLGLVLCWSGYGYLSRPAHLTGRFAGALSHPLFEDAAGLPPALERKLHSARLDMLTSQEGDNVHGMVGSSFGEGDLTGKMTQTSPMIVSYDLAGTIEKPDGRLDLEMTGSYDKLTRLYDWTVKAYFQSRAVKPISDQAKMTFTTVKD